MLTSSSTGYQLYSVKHRVLLVSQKIISVDMTKVDENMLSFLSELESKGYEKNGYLEYEDSDKGEILSIFSKYGFEFTE